MLDERKRDIEKLKTEAADARATTKLIIKTLVRLEAKMDEGFAKTAAKSDFSTHDAMEADAFSVERRRIMKDIRAIQQQTLFYFARI